MAAVNRKKGESFESLLRRFNRKMQLSGKVLQAKKVRFHASPKTKRQKRESALHRARARVLREYLLRSGKVTEEELREERTGRRR